MRLRIPTHYFWTTLYNIQIKWKCWNIVILYVIFRVYWRVISCRVDISCRGSYFLWRRLLLIFQVYLLLHMQSGIPKVGLNKQKPIMLVWWKKKIPTLNKASEDHVWVGAKKNMTVWCSRFPKLKNVSNSLFWIIGKVLLLGECVKFS